MNYKSFKQLFFILCLISFSMVSQSKLEIEKMTKEYDLIKLENLSNKFAIDFETQKNKALIMAAQKGWKLKYKDLKGAQHELVGVTKEGTPLYYKTYNVDAAISTRANFLHNGGGLGLNLEGQGMTIHVWDFGLPRLTHQEYDGIGGEDRVSIGDGTAGLGDHAGHVMGTIISSGFDPAAKGMAPQAKGVAFRYQQDAAKAADAAADGMLISNHSYGLVVRDDNDEPSLPAYYFGSYINSSRDWDAIMYNAPYYLMVTSAGNNGADNSANLEPLEGNAPYDKLTGIATSKNNLVIANGTDAEINEDGSLNSVNRSASSSEGPTDDLRIKPDLMGNGVLVYSTLTTADDDYASYSGTSMASPNVAGSLLLLQQYYNETYGNFMRAATLKGLALHTADDVDIVGPDANTGWGLMNTKVAAETITANGFESWISEEVLKNGDTFSIKVKSDGLSPLLASISWTDKPGVSIQDNITIEPNDPTPALINDLDIKVTRETDEFKPWRLTGVDSNEKGDNLVDPYERVDIMNPSAGEYTITVTHKGTLEEDQRFSLIVTGISGEFTFVADSSEKTFCSDTDAVFNFEYIPAVEGTTQFTATGAHEAMTMSFSENSLSAAGNFDITFGNLINVPAGTYEIEITGDNGSETQIRKVRFEVYHSSFDRNPSELEFPANGQKALAAKVSLLWKENLNAENYSVELSDSPSFNNILFTEEVTTLTIDIEDLQLNSVYYWRVKPKNSCADGAYSPVFSFQTGVIDCENTFTATDLSEAIIDPLVANASAIATINVSEELTVNNIIFTTDISHTSVKELTITIQDPNGNNVVVLSNSNPCLAGIADISNATFSDDGETLFCGFSAPAIRGTIKPENNMSIPFIGQNALGEWKIIVEDNAELNGGQINAASITICASAENTSIPTFTSTSVSLGGSADYVLTPANMSASTASETEEQQVFVLVALAKKGVLKKEGVALTAGDTFTQADITAGKISFTKSEIGSFTDLFIVDVTNDAKGWLPNQTISIQEGVLKVNEFSLNEISLWPNPVKGILNIKINNVNNEDVKISLFDLQGRQISTSTNKVTNTTFTKEIETRNISSGVYLLSIAQGNKKATKKIIISK
ncbi:S8 family serine peptidase [Polaribacter litorisediminis]|uniref:S8 family serine peptidase n=1 Tax=Polaribacter litorisediminis TaxID=1908341 RepID=UPI001CC1AA06|nr:S8 family serine peptidase [Polaribacter litorisediminis]UAM97726.1 S8 family serine peptidase [Polaribacter litorisediminis]